jgi:hypothetical protein
LSDNIVTNLTELQEQLKDKITVKFNNTKLAKMNTKYQKAVIKRNKPIKVKKPRKAKLIDTSMAV